MNSPSENTRDWHERRIDEARRKGVAPEPSTSGAHGRPVTGGAPDPAESRATFAERTKKPRQAGLANEARPGLGTRADEEGSDPSVVPPREASDDGAPRATPHGYEEPRPEPREQPPDSLPHEQERSTGVSGHTGNS